MKAFVFPGQGAQFVGMGKDLYENSALAKELFEKANDILGYRITDIMFNGTDEDLRQTKVTQPAVFLHSVISALCMGDDFKPEMTAGHSLGEFSALVAAGALSFEDGLKLVYARAMAMQKACEAQPSTMAAIIALPDEKVEEICAQVSAEGEVCVAANYNCPGQIVISGSIEGINKACELMKAAGAKRALPLKVGGAFHSPLMNPAKVELEAAINATEIHAPKCPVYQNVDAMPHTDPVEIKKNLVAQLYIVGIKNGAAHSSITLDHSVFIITMAAGVAVSGVLGNSFHHDGLVFLIQFPNRRGCLFRLHIPEHSGSICAKLCFLSIDVLFCLMVDGEHGILLTLSAALRDSGNSYIMLIPQMFYNLLQPVCRKAAHFHTATAGDSAGREMEVQLRSGSFGIFTIQFKEIAHLIENYVIRVTLLDPVVFPYLRGRLLGLQGIFFGQRFFCLDFVILRLFLFGKIAAFLDK